jgi:hypothetical protein
VEGYFIAVAVGMSRQNIKRGDFLVVGWQKNRTILLKCLFSTLRIETTGFEPVRFSEPVIDLLS